MEDVDCTFYSDGTKPAEKQTIVDCGFDPSKPPKAGGSTGNVTSSTPEKPVKSAKK